MINQYGTDANQPLYPKKPVRTALLMFLPMALLFAVLAFFVSCVDPISFLTGGLVYSAFLAFLTLGLALCPFRLARWSLLAVIFLIFLSVLCSLGMLFGSMITKENCDVTAPILFWLLVLWAIVSSAFAVFGWLRFARWHRAAAGLLKEPAIEEAGERTAKIVLKRPAQFSCHAARHWVLLDGREIGSVENGKGKEFDIPAGDHTIQLHVGCWFKSEKLPISAQEGDSIYLESGSYVKGWKILLTPVLLFCPDMWVYIRRRR
ncbi:MAG: hypothetical protein ACYSSL_06655 [Planctomycetota bacterium]|jgi:hypothetical protein